MNLCHCQEWHYSDAGFNPILGFMGLKKYLKKDQKVSQETTKPHHLTQNSSECQKTKKRARRKVTGMNSQLIDRHTPAFYFPIANTHVRFGSRMQTIMMLQVLIKQTLRTCPKQSTTMQLF